MPCKKKVGSGALLASYSSSGAQTSSISRRADNHIHSGPDGNLVIPNNGTSVGDLPLPDADEGDGGGSNNDAGMPILSSRLTSSVPRPVRSGESRYKLLTRNRCYSRSHPRYSSRDRKLPHSLSSSIRPMNAGRENRR